MIVKNVIVNWAFLNRVDENGNYRVQFEVSPEQKKEIFKALEEVAKENKVSLDKCDWKGSYKEEGDKIFFGAKASKVIKKKDGTTIEIELPVYNIRAQRFEPEEVPSIANGAIANLSVEPYYVEYKSKKGVMLGLRSIQLLKYELYEGSSNPFMDESDGAPFDAEEERSIFQ